MKRIVLIAAALVGVLSAYSAELLENGSFEKYKIKASFLGTSTTFEGWDFQGIMAVAYEVDTLNALDGKAAFRTNSENKSKGAYIFQELDCSEYQTGEEFDVRVCYKHLNEIDSALVLDCYWETTSGSTEPMEQTADMKQLLPYSATWDSVTFRVTKLEKARYFCFKVRLQKNALVELDKCSFRYVEPIAPYFTIIPDKDYYSTTAQINTDTVMAKIVVRQFNLKQPVQLTITGTGKAAFSIDKTQMTKEEDTVTVHFKASIVGQYSASLNINDDESPETSLMNRSISLSATAIDTTKAPIITITPMEFDTFRCKAYESVTDTFIVHSENCYDYVHVVVDDETGPEWAFGISGSFFLKNTTDTVVITFAPKKEGVYTARYKAYTSGMDTIFFSTVGVASDGKPAPIVVDWDTTFVWNLDNPYAELNENFRHSDTCRNKTLKTSDWQNVVTKGQRPWWGYYSDSTTQAKAVSYYYDQDSGVVDMEMWLVTPPLDYKNASPQIFSFKVMSDLIYKGQTGKLELYFIDPTDTAKVYFEHIVAVDSLIPANDSELEYNWIPIVMDLSKVSIIPDVFYMAFRFTDRGGNNGVVYYITDVTWGIDPTGVEQVTGCRLQVAGGQKIILNGHLYIRCGDMIYNANGQRLK